MAAEKTAELTDKLNRFLDQLIDGLQKGGELVAEQAPLVVQELIAWKRAEHTLMALAFLAFAVWWALWLRKKWAEKLAKVQGYDADIARVFGWVGWTAIMGGSTIGLVIQTHYALQVWLAPRVYLIEYIADLIKRK